MVAAVMRLEQNLVKQITESKELSKVCTKRTGLSHTGIHKIKQVKSRA